MNCTIVRKSSGQASCYGHQTHFYHVTHDDSPGQEFMFAKHSVRVEVGCRNPEDIIEDNHPPSQPEDPVPLEDQTFSLRESRTNAGSSLKAPSG